MDIPKNLRLEYDDEDLESRDSILHDQVRPGSVIRLKMIKRPGKPERVMELLGVSTELMFSDLSNKDFQNLADMLPDTMVVIVHDSGGDLAEGNVWGRIQGGLRVDEPFVLTFRGLLGNTHQIDVVKEISAKKILPDEVTFKAKELLKKYYRGNLSSQMQGDYDGIKQGLGSNVYQDIAMRMPIDLLDIRTKVGYLIAQWFDEIEATGTLPMDEGEFVRRADTLWQFTAANDQVKGMVKRRNSTVKIKNEKGEDVEYEIYSPYYIANDQAESFWYEKKSS